jgi:phosphopantothenoylcysteine decarboxylase/phosphopantothenate--cysteine ligase
LETEDPRFRALAKLEQKHCDLMVSNGPQAIDADENQVELLDGEGAVIEGISGSKQEVADRLLAQICRRLMNGSVGRSPGE